jgi:putative ABC transport system ATP-binding protein
MPVLEAIGVCKQYGTETVQVRALQDVDVRVESGEFLAIMGPSGCGKSTLLHVLGGIDAPTTGRVLLKGQDVGNLDDAARSIVRRRQLGFVFQKMNLLSTLSAVENVALPLRIDGVRRATARKQALDVLGSVGIAHRADRFPHEMSGGEQQRVAIARALVVRPAVVLADEPTGALDSANGQHIMELLRDCVEQGQTIVMVTHDRDMARQASRIIRMQDGSVISGVEHPDAPSTFAVPR